MYIVKTLLLFPWVFTIGWFEKLMGWHIVLDEDNMFKIIKVLKKDDF